MLYGLREYLHLALLYDSVETVRACVDRVLAKKLFAWGVARSVHTGVSLFADPWTVFQAPLTLQRDFSERRISDGRLLPYKEVLLRELFSPGRLAETRSRIDRELILCGEYGLRVYGYEDERYPAGFRHLEAPPPVLFIKGNFPPDAELARSVAIIGMREPEEVVAPVMARFIAGMLARKGWWNISGLAHGCDTFGHVASLEAGGKTGAVLGNGLAAELYPVENTLIAEAIVEQDGFLLSECIPSAPASRVKILLRERMQSSLVRALFVVETDLRSGTLFTVDQGFKLNKTVFVFDPKDTPLRNTHHVSGNELLLGRMRGDRVFAFDSYERRDVVPIDSGDVFHGWLEYMNGDATTMPC